MAALLPCHCEFGVPILLSNARRTWVRRSTTAPPIELCHIRWTGRVEPSNVLVPTFSFLVGADRARKGWTHCPLVPVDPNNGMGECWVRVPRPGPLPNEPLPLWGFLLRLGSNRLEGEWLSKSGLSIPDTIDCCLHGDPTVLVFVVRPWHGGGRELFAKDCEIGRGSWIVESLTPTSTTSVRNGTCHLFLLHEIPTGSVICMREFACARMPRTERPKARQLTW